MKLSYKTKDILMKIGFVLMLTGFIMAVGYSYMECQTRIVSEIISETPNNLENAIKVKMK